MEVSWFISGFGFAFAAVVAGLRGFKLTLEIVENILRIIDLLNKIKGNNRDKDKND